MHPAAGQTSVVLPEATGWRFSQGTSTLVGCNAGGVFGRVGTLRRVGDVVGDRVEPRFHWKKEHFFPSLVRLHYVVEKVRYREVEDEGANIQKP